MSLEQQLKELLKEKKYTIAYAARAINVSPTTLHLWMNNNYKGNVEKVNKAVQDFLELALQVLVHHSSFFVLFYLILRKRIIAK